MVKTIFDDQPNGNQGFVVMMIYAGLVFGAIGLALCAVVAVLV